MVRNALLLTLAAASWAAAGECGPARPAVEAHLLEGRRWEARALADRCADEPGLSPAFRAEALREAGRVSLAVGDALGAQDRLRRSLALAPSDADARLLFAQALRARPEDALAEAKRAAKRLRSPAQAAAAWRLAGDLALDLDDPRGARRAYEKALGAEPDDLDALGALVRLEARGSKAAAAWAERACLAAARAPDWHRADSFRHCARSWTDAGDAGRAADAYFQAISARPDDLDAYEALAELRRSAQEAVEAARARAPAPAPERQESLTLEQARAALAAAPAEPYWRQASAYRRAAAALFAAGEAATAAAAVRHALNADLRAPRTIELMVLNNVKGPPLARSYLDLGEAREHAGDYDGAQAALRAALECVPPDPFAARALADLARKRGRPAEALAYADRRIALAEPSERPWAILEKARLQGELGDAAGARASLESAVAATPGFAPLLRELLRLQMAAGLWPRARRTADRLVAASVNAPPFQRAQDLAQRDFARNPSSLPRPPVQAPHAPLPAQVHEPDSTSSKADTARTAAAALREQAQREAARRRLPQALELASRLSAAEGLSDRERAESLALEGELLLALGRAPEAEERLARSLELDPERLSALWLLVAAPGAEPARALALVEKHRPAGPEARAAWLALRGLTQGRLGREKRAARDFADAVALSAESACRGELFAARRERLDLPYLSACAERFPKDVRLRVDRGVALFRAGRKKEAAEDFRAAVGLEPGNQEARRSLDAALAP